MTLVGFKSIPLSLAQLSLAVVLKCGQSFRWSIFAAPTSESQQTGVNGSEVSHLRVEYRLCLKDRVVCLRQSPDTLFYRSVFPDPQPSSEKRVLREAETLEWLKDYFQLHIDLISLYKQWAEGDKVFARFQDRFVGIRILRQDPWENVISFICSSNNNISRITKMVQNLCTHYSPSLLSLEHPFSPTEMLTYHPFPSPSALAGSGVGLQLRSLGFGYRADYIQRTAKILVGRHGSGKPLSPHEAIEASEIWLRQLRKSSTVDAREELLKFVGVGRKVADCILLMSLDKKEVVPVDTHVYQIATKYYGMKGPASRNKVNITPKLYEEVNTKFLSIWGEYAGWAHTVLFTTDLKSFSTYGLPSPSPSATTSSTSQKKKGKKLISQPTLGIPTPPMTPSPLKRKLDSESELDLENQILSSPISQLCHEAEEVLSLVDRVKKRRRKM